IRRPRFTPSRRNGRSAPFIAKTFPLMNLLLVLEQALNGLQLGVMLFLMAAGLTLVFGIMNLVNLAHGSFYMVGAYRATYFYQATGSYLRSEERRVGKECRSRWWT